MSNNPNIQVIKHSEFYYEIVYVSENQTHKAYCVSNQDETTSITLTNKLSTLDGGLWTTPKGQDEKQSKQIFDNFTKYLIGNLKKSLPIEENNS